MDYRKLGSTGIEVSAMAMGCWALAGDAVWGPQDEADTVATVRAALDAGVNLFDTAEGYGDGASEAALGRALAGRRHEAVIATKVSPTNLSPDALVRACEASLRRLQTDHVDLYQIHWPNWQMPLAETVEALQHLQAQGKIRAVGVCNFGVRDLSDLLAIGRCESNQLPYSLLWRAVEHEIQPKCLASGVGMLTYMPLMQGLLTGKFAGPDDVPQPRARTRHFSKSRPMTRHGEPGWEAETFETIARIRRICERSGVPMAVASIAWVLSKPGVTAVLAGARKPEQIAENVRAVELKLSPEVVAELDTATEDLKARLGPNPDLYQSGTASRFR